MSDLVDNKAERVAGFYDSHRQFVPWLTTGNGLVLGFVVSLLDDVTPYSQAERVLLFGTILSLALSFLSSPLLLMYIALSSADDGADVPLPGQILGLVLVAGLAIGLLSLTMFAGFRLL